MCVVEQKTYYQPDGSQKAFDRVHRCDIANQPGAPVCSNATRTSGAARIVEIKPETTASSSLKKDEIVTDNNGRPRIYRDIGRRSSHKYKTGHSKRSNDRSSLDGRPSAFDTFKTRQPSPVSRPTTPSSAPPRMDSFPPTIRSEPSVRVNRSGTAVYDSAPSLNMPRASDNERRKVSFEHDSTDRPRFERRPERRPSLKVQTGGPRSGDVPPMTPGLSRLPSLRQTHKRTDSAHDHPTRDPSPIRRNDREYADREAAREASRRQKALDEAILRRQEDLEALENQQLDREAERAQVRRSFDPLHRLPDTLYPPRTPQEGSWSRNTSPPTLPSHSRPAQTRTRFASSSPLSPHTTHRHRNYGHTVVHQYHYPDPPAPAPAASSSRRPSDSIRERGREVIERERARAAAAAAAAEDRYPADENARAGESHWQSEPVFDEVEERISGREYYHVSEGSARSEIRRRRDRDDSRRREERRDEFFR
jgi:hypothetical protein